MELEIRRADPQDLQFAYGLVSEYYDSLRVVARDTRKAFAQEYFRPRCGFWLAYANHQLAGCVALRALPAAGCSEIKRMYVRPPWRGAGIAQKLLEEVERFAEASGYSWIYLDTADEMKAAARLYQRNGYQPCERYNDNPQAALFFRKPLTAALQP